MGKLLIMSVLIMSGHSNGLRWTLNLTILNIRNLGESNDRCKKLHFFAACSLRLPDHSVLRMEQSKSLSSSRFESRNKLLFFIL